jgi:hypothetical protein
MIQRLGRWPPTARQLMMGAHWHQLVWLAVVRE